MIDWRVECDTSSSQWGSDNKHFWSSTFLLTSLEQENLSQASVFSHKNGQKKNVFIDLFVCSRSCLFFRLLIAANFKLAEINSVF